MVYVVCRCDVLRIMMCTVLHCNLSMESDYRRHFGEYNAKSIECDLKSFVLKGHHGGIRKEKQQHYRGWNGREFCIFWVHKAEFFLRADAHQFQVHSQYPISRACICHIVPCVVWLVWN